MTEREAEREAFEQWYVENAFDYVRDPIGSRECAVRWEGWQARAAIQGAQVSKDAEDARRYRWLRDHGYTMDDEKRGIENELLPAGETFPGIDEAIDAAMAPSGETS